MYWNKKKLYLVINDTFLRNISREALEAGFDFRSIKKKVIELLKTCFESTNVIQEFNDCYNVVQSL